MFVYGYKERIAAVFGRLRWNLFPDTFYMHTAADPQHMVAYSKREEMFRLYRPPATSMNSDYVPLAVHSLSSAIFSSTFAKIILTNISGR